MEDLIKALQIFLKYGNPYAPTHCEHDVLYICNIDHDAVTPEDEATLKELGFERGLGDDVGDNGFASYRFGSA